MVLPVVEVKVTADTAQATANLSTFGKELSVVPSTAKRASKASSGLSGSLKRMGNVSNRTRAQIQNTAFQLQDMAVQFEMGTNASRVMSQQLPQLLGGFGALGAVLGVVAGVGIPLLAFAFKDIGGGANELKESLDELTGSTADLNTELQLLKTGLVSAEELAVFNQIKKVEAERLVTLEKIRALGGLESASLNRRLSQQTRTIELLELELNNHKNVRSEIEARTAQQRQSEKETRDAIQAVDDLTDAERLMGEQMVNATREAANLKVELQLARDAAMAAAAEFVTMQALRSRFAGEDALMRMPVTPSGRGGPESPIGGGGGGGGDDGRLESLVEQLQTEQELAEQFRADGLELLKTASVAELEALGGINEAKLRLEQEYQDRLAGIKKQSADSQLALTLGAGSDVLNALGAFNDKAFKAAKVAAAAQALVSTFQGAAEALKLPFPANLAAAAAVTAKGLGLVAAIKGVSSSGVGGGGAGTAAAAPVAAQSPLNVRLSGLGAGDSITGGQLSSLFDRLKDEAGDRGLNVSFAT